LRSLYDTAAATDDDDDDDGRIVIMRFISRMLLQTQPSPRMLKVCGVNAFFDPKLVLSQNFKDLVE
jgi:hypothetical protein